MNEAIELHDSELGALSWSGGSAVLCLRPAYIHRSTGRPGIEEGSGWVQDATLTITSASVLSDIELPGTVVEGTVRIGDDTLPNVIPGSGIFLAPITVELLLSSGETLVVCGQSLTIALEGMASYVEEFKP